MQYAFCLVYHLELNEPNDILEVISFILIDNPFLQSIIAPNIIVAVDVE